MIPKRSPAQKRQRARLLIGGSFIIGAIGAVFIAVRRDQADEFIGLAFVVLSLVLGIASISDWWRNKEQ